MAKESRANENNGRVKCFFVLFIDKRYISQVIHFNPLRLRVPVEVAAKKWLKIEIETYFKRGSPLHIFTLFSNVPVSCYQDVTTRKVLELVPRLLVDFCCRHFHGP